jgi:hypothetical protein
VNSGIIGDRVLRSSFGGTTPEHGYGQVDNFGVLMMNGRIVNQASGIITGYNAIFTQGNAAANRIDNYGMIDASNDGVLSSYLIVNHRGAAINTGVAGFACVHAYGNVVNFGYMLGQDYGMLLEGSNTTVVTYGGPRVAGVANFDGSPVYNGEISSILRSTGKVNSGGPYLSGDAVMMDTEHSTLTLRSTSSGGHVWLPVIKGPMVGGFNGDFDSPSAHQSNTLGFDFNGLGAAQLGALRAAVARSVHHGVRGRYFSGQADVRGHLYHWVDWASVAVRDSAAPAATSPTPAPAPSSTAIRQDLAAPAEYITRPGQPASVAATQGRGHDGCRLSAGRRPARGGHDGHRAAHRPGGGARARPHPAPGWPPHSVSRPSRNRPRGPGVPPGNAAADARALSGSSRSRDNEAAGPRVAGPRGTAALPARAGGAAGRHLGLGPRPGQARRRARGAYRGGRLQGPPGEHWESAGRFNFPASSAFNATRGYQSGWPPTGVRISWQCGMAAGSCRGRTYLANRLG